MSTLIPQFSIPTTEQVRNLRLKDGPNFSIAQEYLNNLQMDVVGNLYFPIYALDGSPVGWNSRLISGPSRWSQFIQHDLTPRFCSWTQDVAATIHLHRKICICEGPFDALALAPVLPFVISSNTARISNEILWWCKMWGLDVFLALDQDTVDPRTGKATGQAQTLKAKAELERYGCRVAVLDWETVGRGGTRIKDPAQAFAHWGPAFHSEVLTQVTNHVEIFNLVRNK